MPIHKEAKRARIHDRVSGREARIAARHINGRTAAEPAPLRQEAPLTANDFTSQTKALTKAYEEVKEGIQRLNFTGIERLREEIEEDCKRLNAQSEEKLSPLKVAFEDASKNEERLLSNKLAFEDAQHQERVTTIKNTHVAEMEKRDAEIRGLEALLGDFEVFDTMAKERSIAKVNRGQVDVVAVAEYQGIRAILTNVRIDGPELLSLMPPKLLEYTLFNAGRIDDAASGAKMGNNVHVIKRFLNEDLRASKAKKDAAEKDYTKLLGKEDTAHWDARKRIKDEHDECLRSKKKELDNAALDEARRVKEVLKPKTERLEQLTKSGEKLREDEYALALGAYRYAIKRFELSGRSGNISDALGIFLLQLNETHARNEKGKEVLARILLEYLKEKLEEVKRLGAKAPSQAGLRR